MLANHACWLHPSDCQDWSYNEGRFVSGGSMPLRVVVVGWGLPWTFTARAHSDPRVLLHAAATVAKVVAAAARAATVAVAGGLMVSSALVPATPSDRHVHPFVGVVTAMAESSRLNGNSVEADGNSATSPMQKPNLDELQVCYWYVFTYVVYHLYRDGEFRPVLSCWG